VGVLILKMFPASAPIYTATQEVGFVSCLDSGQRRIREDSRGVRSASLKVRKLHKLGSCHLRIVL